MAAFESGGAAGIAAITKFGWIKLLTLGAAGLGALLMAIFRPPKNRKEMFFQAVVALGSSLLFGNTIAMGILHYAPFINVHSFEDFLQYQVSIHGLVGALGWGVFGGLSHTRDKIGSKSLDETYKDVRDNLR